MKYLFLTIASWLTLACHAWTPVIYKQAPLDLFMSSTGIPNEIDDGYWSDEFEDDPCWQNIYDDDCAMSTANLAFFKASVWVKGMPCAKGIEVNYNTLFHVILVCAFGTDHSPAVQDCDMPEAMQTPEVRPHEEVDVMEFLHLKRAKHIGEPAEKEDEDPAKP